MDTIPSSNGSKPPGLNGNRELGLPPIGSNGSEETAGLQPPEVGSQDHSEPVIHPRPEGSLQDLSAKSWETTEDHLPPRLHDFGKSHLDQTPGGHSQSSPKQE